MRCGVGICANHEYNAIGGDFRYKLGMMAVWVKTLRMAKNGLRIEIGCA